MKAIKIYYRQNGEGVAELTGYRVLRDDGRRRNDLQLMMALTNREIPWLRLDVGQLDVKRLK